MKIIFIPTSKHREAKVRRFLGICLYDCFIYSSNKCLETRRHLGSGRKTVNSQGYSELREPIKTPKIAIHWFGKYYNIIYHKSNNENLTTPRQEPFLHNDINNHLSFGWVSKRNYNWRISTKLRVDIDRIHRTRHHPGTMRVKYPVSKLQWRKKSWCYFAYEFTYFHAKLSTRCRVNLQQNKMKGYLKCTSVIEKISSVSVRWFCLFQLCWGKWSGCEYNLVSVYNLLSRVFSLSCLLVSAILKTENDPGNYEYLKEKTERGQRVVFFANGIFRTLPTRLRHYSQASTLSRCFSW